VVLFEALRPSCGGSNDGAILTPFIDPQLQLVKKALAMSAVAIELRSNPAQPAPDHAATKAPPSDIAGSGVEFECCFVAVRLAISGKPQEMPRSATP
jgi:hypothetical protein